MRTVLLPLLLGCLLLAGCGRPAPEMAPAPSPAATQAAPGSDKTWQELVPRKLIRTATLNLEVEDAAAALERLRSFVADEGGFVTRSEISGTEVRTARVEVKIPAERLGSALERLAGLGRVHARTESAQDVTEEYVDLTARVRNLRREEERLLALVDRSGSVQALQEVERELARVRGEIEQIEGRVKFLDHSVSYSTVNLDLYERVPREVRSFWDVRQDLENAWTALLYLLRFAVQVVIYGTVLIVPVALPVALLWRRRRRS